MQTEVTPKLFGINQRRQRSQRIAPKGRNPIAKGVTLGKIEAVLNVEEYSPNPPLPLPRRG
jgi:hypothetical protein